MKAASFFDVVNAMKTRMPLTMARCPSPVQIKSIELESGNGRTWNVGVELMPSGNKETVFYNEDSTMGKFFLRD